MSIRYFFAVRCWTPLSRFQTSPTLYEKSYSVRLHSPSSCSWGCFWEKRGKWSLPNLKQIRALSATCPLHLIEDTIWCWATQHKDFILQFRISSSILIFKDQNSRFLTRQLRAAKIIRGKVTIYALVRGMNSFDSGISWKHDKFATKIFVSRK